MNKNERIRLLTIGLCCGDALGSTSEFIQQQDIPKLYERYRDRSWPFAQVGEGPFDWSKGQHTDDGAMACAMVRSFVERGEFDPSHIAKYWVNWMDSHPPDIGNATRSGLSSVKRGMHWHEGGLGDFLRNSKSAANGSLMRNAPIVGMADSLWQAFDFGLKQSIVTHYGPLPVLCCCAQSFLLWQLLEGQNPFERRWRDDFFETFTEWLQDSKDSVVRGWADKTIKSQLDAWKTFLGADFEPDSFSPFGYAFDGRDGYCLLTLQIGVWAVRWSVRGTAYPTPMGFPKEVFEKAIGPSFLSVIGLIGHDSDTYGATAGPLIAAAHGQLPAQLTEGLEVFEALADMKLSVDLDSR